MREPDFSQTCGFREKLEYLEVFRFKAFPAKSNDSIFLKMAKTFKNGLFLHIIRIYPKTGFFSENPKTLFFLHFRVITSCQKSEKTNDWKYEIFCLRTNY